MECFTVYADDLKGILSPLFFMSRPANTKGSIELNKIAEINPSRKIDNLDSNDMVPYVGLPETGNLEVKEVLKRPYKEVKGRNIIKKGDILFARIEPSIFNKKYILADDLQGNDYAFASTEFYIVKARGNVNPKFLFYMFFTRQVYLQVLGRTTGSTGRRRLDRGVFEHLLIPFPNRETQDKIARLFDESYLLKKSKEAQAQKLLDAINDYILDELGIKLPEMKDRMSYVINSDEAQSKRVDPYYYQPKFKEVEKAIKKGEFEVKELNSITQRLINGLDYREFTDEGLPYIRVSNIRPHSLNLRDLKYIPEMEVSKDIQLKKSDVLITRKGTFGVATAAGEKCEKCVISSEIFRVVLNETINPNYLASWLNSRPQQVMFDRIKTGAIMGHLSQKALLQIKIPVPPVGVQNKIAEEVKRRMQRAERLQSEAKEELERAKQEAEEVVVGGK